MAMDEHAPSKQYYCTQRTFGDFDPRRLEVSVSL
jgi:hypothetical protein